MKATPGNPTRTGTLPVRALAPTTSSREVAILATLLESPEALPPNLGRLLQHAPESFGDLRHGAIAEAILTVRKLGRPVHVFSVGEVLCQKRSSDGTSPILDQLPGRGLPLGLAELEAETIWQAYRARRLKSLFSDAQDCCERNPGDLVGVVDHVRAGLDSLTNDALPRYVARSIGELRPQPADADDELIARGYLRRGHGLLLPAPSGIGKSTFAVQAMLLWAAGRECLGFKPTRPIRSLYVQAENDETDLRELRDGILLGLRFTDEERAQALANTLFVSIDDLCGVEFITQAVEPLCREIKPHILWIDPLLAYIGGDVSRQEIVSPWLRNNLNPVLHRYRVACVLVHHTNKPPSGREKPDWKAADFAYLGSGSAELANWPRAVVAIRGTGSHEVFELRLGKRGARLGWKDADGSPSYSRFIAHASDGIYWREVDQAEAPAPPGRRQEHNVAEIVALIEHEKLSAADWQKLCRTEAGISERSFYRLKKIAESSKLVAQSPIDKLWFKTP